MKKVIAFLMAGLVCLGVSGCSAGDKAYPITVDGTDILVGETTISTLIDAGFTIRELSYSDDNEITGDTMLEKNSYYSGLYAYKEDIKYCTIEIVTDKKDVPLAEAVIAKVIIKDDLSHTIGDSMFDGVKLTEMTVETAQEHIEGSKLSEDNLSVSLSGSKYFVSIHFDENGFLDLEMKCKYDVDYRS